MQPMWIKYTNDEGKKVRYCKLDRTDPPLKQLFADWNPVVVYIKIKRASLTIILVLALLKPFYWKTYLRVVYSIAINIVYDTALTPVALTRHMNSFGKRPRHVISGNG